MSLPGVEDPRDPRASAVPADFGRGPHDSRLAVWLLVVRREEGNEIPIICSHIPY